MVTYTTAQTQDARESDLVDVVRKIGEYVTILKEGTVSKSDESTFVTYLAEEVKNAYRLMGHVFSAFSNESVAITLDEAIRVLNVHGRFGAVAQVQITSSR